MSISRRLVVGLFLALWNGWGVALAIAAQRAMSVTRSKGFEGVSSQSSFVSGRIAFSIASGVRICRIVMPPNAIRDNARADRVAMSSQIGWPDGASAACGSDMPSASPTTCEVAAVPRNWQPPPGDPHVRQPCSAA